MLGPICDGVLTASLFRTALVGPGRGHHRLAYILVNGLLKLEVKFGESILNRLYECAKALQDTELCERVWNLIPPEKRYLFDSMRFVKLYNDVQFRPYLMAVQNAESARNTANTEPSTQFINRLHAAAVIAARRLDFQAVAHCFEAILTEGAVIGEKCVSAVLVLANTSSITPAGVETLMNCLETLKIPIPPRKWHRVLLACTAGESADMLQRMYDKYLKAVQDGEMRVHFAVVSAAVLGFGQLVSAEAGERVFEQLVFNHKGSVTAQLLRLLLSAYKHTLSRGEHFQFFQIARAAFPQNNKPLIKTDTSDDVDLLRQALNILVLARKRSEATVSGTRRLRFWSDIGKFHVPVLDAEEATERSGADAT